MPDAADAADPASSHADPLVDTARAATMRPVLALARRAARTSANVLISGETGSGRRSLARWIHAHSARHDRPLIAVSSAALGEALRAGMAGARGHALLSEASGGTLVIDELADLSYEAQAALVHWLEARPPWPGGSADTRVIATSEAGSRGRLRDDLYYATAVIAIAMPPLRERTEDIPALVARILARSQGAVSITEAALARLAGAAWPGNVRELETAIERAIALSDHAVIDVAQLASLERAGGDAVTSPAHRRRQSCRR